MLSSLTAKLALGVIFSVCAFLLASSADPYPHYARPSSLFFPEVKAPPPPVKPKPAPIAKRPEYVASFDLGKDTATEEGISIPAGDLVSWRIETIETPAPRQSTVSSKPMAFAIIGDCSALLGGSMPQYIQPAKLLQRFSSSDLVAFMTVADGARKLLDWTPRDEAVKKAPSDYGAGGAGYQPDTSVEPILELFRDPAIRGKQPVAVMLGDLVGNREDEHVLACARALSGAGVKVFVVKYGDAPLNPEVVEVCRGTGGEVIQSQSIAQIGEGLQRVHEQIGGATRTYRLHLRFRSPRAYRAGDKVEVPVNGTNRTGKIESVVP